MTILSSRKMKSGDRLLRDFGCSSDRRLLSEPSAGVVWLLMVLILLVLMAFAWTILGRLDIVVSAHGHLQSATYTRTIQPLRTSRIEHIYVSEGDHVKRGQLLVQLDTDADAADFGRAREQLIQCDLDSVRVRALIKANDDGSYPIFPDPKISPPSVVAEERVRAIDQFIQQKAKVESLKSQISEKYNEALETAAQIRQSVHAISLLSAEADIRRHTLAMGVGNKIDVLEIYERLRQQQDGVAVLRSRVLEEVSSRQSLVAQLLQARQDYRTSLWDDLQKDLSDRRQAFSDEEKARSAIATQSLRSPDDGTVQQLTVNTIGGVVTPAQSLMAVVPDAGGLTVNLQVANKDIGFIHQGQPVIVKVDAYPFAQYGTLKGRVTHISRDAALKNHTSTYLDAGPEGGDNLNTGSAHQTNGEGDDYIITVSLFDPNHTVRGIYLSLVAGMSVNADIVTGRRSVFTYLISRIDTVAGDSLGER